MADLEHNTEDCVGHWRLVGGLDDRSVRCEQCGADLPATAERRLAAIDENYAGIYLRRLTAEGASQLQEKRGRD